MATRGGRWTCTLAPSAATLNEYVCGKTVSEKFYISPEHESLRDAVPAAAGRVIGLSNDIDRVWDYVWCLYYLRRAPLCAPRATAIDWLYVPQEPAPPQPRCMLSVTPCASDVLWSNSLYSLCLATE